MNQELKQLVVADRHDRKAEKIKASALAAKADVAECEATLTRLGKEHDQTTDAINDNKTAQATVRRTIKEYENHRQAAERMLQTGSGDPEAAQRQFDACGQRIDDEETGQLELMEAGDALAEQLADLEKQQEAWTTKLNDLQAKLEPLLVEKRAAYAAETNLRDQALASLQPNTKSKYLGFRSKGKWAVSQIVTGGCSACGRVVHSQHLGDIKRGIMRPCTSCFRWVVPPETDS